MERLERPIYGNGSDSFEMNTLSDPFLTMNYYPVYYGEYNISNPLLIKLVLTKFE